MKVILVECDVVSPAGVASTLRFSDRAIWPMAPTDALRPNVAWDERLIEPPTIRRELFDDLQALDPGIGVGSMSLANADRALDAYQGHVWGEVRVWRWTVGTAFSTAKALIRGPAAGTPGFERLADRPARVRLMLYDYRLELEKPVQSATYGGTNNGSTILYDGDAATKGQLKPLAFGNLLTAHIPGVLVNRAIGAYQIHDGRFATLPHPEIMKFYDRGGAAGLNQGGDYGPVDAARAPGTPSYFDGYNQSGYYGVESYKGLVRGNGALVGTVTFGIMGDAPAGAYVETPGPVIDRVLRRSGVPAGRIGPSVAAAASTAVVGFYVADATPAREVVGAIARSAPMAVLPDRQGVWQAVPFAPPKPAPDLTLTSAEILKVEADDVSSVGAGEISIGYDRLWTTYRREAIQPALLGTPAESRLAEQFRRASVEDTALKARYPAWRKVSIDTALRNEADATALAGALKTLFGLRADGRPRRRWRVTLEMTDAALAWDLGATIRVSSPEAGLDDNFLLIAEEPMRPRRDLMIWTVWG